MVETATAAAPSIGLEFDAPDTDIIIAKPKELAIQCVVFVGNLLTARQMKIPNYRLGGKLFPFPDFYTVPKGIVARCAITRLQKAMRSVHKSQVPEAQWPNWVHEFTLRNQWNPVTQSYEDTTVGTDGYSKDLVYKEIRPINEIGRIAGKNEGVVAFDEECGISNGADIKEAQFHYFPNWLELLAQKEFLPETHAALIYHIRNRREQTNSANMRAIGDAFLLSASDWRDWGKEQYIDLQTAAIKETEKTGGVRYSEVAERLFREFELQRQDQLVEGMAKDRNDAATQQASLTTAVTLLAEIAARQEKAERSLPPAEHQAPAPTTIEEAAKEVERSVSEDVTVPAPSPEAAPVTEFEDMSSMVFEPDPTEEAEIDVPNPPEPAIE